MLSTFILVMTFYGSGYNAGGPAVFTIEYHERAICERDAAILTKQLEEQHYRAITSICLERNP